jgi:hypothetical protein
MMITFKVYIHISYKRTKIFEWLSSQIIPTVINMSYTLILYIHISKVKFVARIILPSLILHNHITNMVIISQNDLLILLV